VLGDAAPTSAGVDSYTSDPGSLPLTDFGKDTGGGGLWGDAAQWDWNWQQNPAGTAVSWVSAPLGRDTTVIGSGAVYAWVESSAPDVDLQATISEVRPDGNETFVQNGWIRASERKLSTSTDNELHQPSTLLAPVPSFMAGDASPMPSGSFVRVAIPLYYEGHVYRAGSRIRLTISAPNGTQPVWSFSDTEPPLGKSSSVQVAMSPAMPSSLVLPVVSGVTVPTGLPACPSLRNEPCRPYAPLPNEVVSTTAANGESSVALPCTVVCTGVVAPAGPSPTTTVGTQVETGPGVPGTGLPPAEPRSKSRLLSG
jgi:predicted acyl esterase